MMEHKRRETGITMGQRDGDKCMKVDLQRDHNIPPLTTVDSLHFLFPCTKGFHYLYIGTVWTDTVYTHKCNNRDSNLRPPRLKEHLINLNAQSKLL
jgi:hypothetical protein